MKVKNWKAVSDNRKIARNNQAVEEKLQELAQNQRIIQEKLEFADKMDRYARFFRQRAENADRSMRERKLSNIEQSLWNIENDLNRR